MRTPRLSGAFLLPLFFCSGAAGLGQQMVWARLLAAGLGHEAAAVLAVTAAFLGGMAVGSWVLSQAMQRTTRAAAWYGGLELLIGAWGVASAFVLPMLNDAALRWTGPAPSPLRQWLVVFSFPFLGLLPATAAMGATFAAMERFLSEMGTAASGPPARGPGSARSPGPPFAAGPLRCVGAVYAANTAGAVFGILGGAFGLMPALGFRRSLLVLAAVNGICGLLACLIGWKRARPDAVGAALEWPATVTSRRAATGARSRDAAASARAAGSDAPPAEGSRGRVRLTLLCSGVLGIGFQWTGIRLLSQVLENTLYTFAAALAVYLLGSALGAALYQRWARGAAFSALLSTLLGAAGVACLLGANAGRWLHPIYDWWRDRLGDQLLGVAGAEMTVSACVFLLPTMVTGALCSHLLQREAGDAAGLGRAVALNTVGCALAPILFGLMLVPALGVKGSVIAIAAGYLLLLPRLRRHVLAQAAVAVAIGLVALLPRPLRLVDLPPGAQLREYREGILAAVAVVQTADEHRSLRVNNRLQMGGTAAALAERRQAHLALLLHPHPQRALFLGPGTGITLGAAAVYPGLQSDGVELVPGVLEVMGAFEPFNNGVLRQSQVHLQAADARRFVRTTTNRYDVIVADLFHPAQDGAGFLYTREHYEAIRHCLRPAGLFCQWLPLHQLDEPGLQSIVRTFLAVFPETHAVLLHFNVDIPVLGLIGMDHSWHLAGDWLERPLATPGLQEALRQAGLDKAIQVLGCWAAGPAALARYAQTGELSTDDRPVILFEAAHHAVQRNAQAHEVLMSFLAQVRGGADSFARQTLEGGAGAFGDHLTAYIAARDLYLQGLVEEGAGRFSSAIDAYLSSAQHSLYFTPSYARCVTIIQVMAATDRSQARALFQRLEAAQPAQPLGRKLLGKLFE